MFEVARVLWTSVIKLSLCWSSQFVYQEALVTTISDMYPALFQSSSRRKLLLLAICVGSFLIGLLMVTEVRGELPCHLYFPVDVDKMGQGRGGSAGGRPTVGVHPEKVTRSKH